MIFLPLAQPTLTPGIPQSHLVLFSELSLSMTVKHIYFLSQQYLSNIMNIKLTLVIIFFWPGQAFPSWGPHWSRTRQQPFAPQSLHTHGSSPGGGHILQFSKHAFSSFGIFTHQPHLSALIPGIPPACANCTTDQCVIWHLPTHLFSGVSIFWRQNHFIRKVSNMPNPLE